MYCYKWLLFSHEKEGNPTTCDNRMDFEGIMLNEICQTETNNAWYHLYVESKTIIFFSEQREGK